MSFCFFVFLRFFFSGWLLCLHHIFFCLSKIKKKEISEIRKSPFCCGPHRLSLQQLLWRNSQACIVWLHIVVGHDPVQMESGDKRKAHRKKKPTYSFIEHSIDKKREKEKEASTRFHRQSRWYVWYPEILIIANCLSKQLESRQGVGLGRRLCYRNQNFCATDRNAGRKNQCGRCRPGTEGKLHAIKETRAAASPAPRQPVPPRPKLFI